MNDIILLGSEATEVPDWFKRRLKDIDRALVCYYNPFRQTFVIDRCTHGNDCLSEKHVECPKTNVMLFEHIGENAIQKLKGMDAWTKTGGNDDAALHRFKREHEIAKEEYDAKRKEEARESYKEACLDNRQQLTKALHLIQQHDVARVHK